MWICIQRARSAFQYVTPSQVPGICQTWIEVLQLSYSSFRGMGQRNPLLRTWKRKRNILHTPHHTKIMGEQWIRPLRNENKATTATKLSGSKTSGGLPKHLFQWSIKAVSVSDSGAGTQLNKLSEEDNCQKGTFRISYS